MLTRRQLWMEALSSVSGNQAPQLSKPRELLHQRERNTLYMVLAPDIIEHAQPEVGRHFRICERPIKQAVV